MVEDAPEIAELMGLLLMAHVAQVTLRIERFEDLIAETDWVNVDAVITDRRLGSYDGCDLLNWLAKNQPQVGRIMLTGDTTVEFDHCSAQILLPKPIPKERLLHAISEVTHG